MPASYVIPEETVRIARAAFPKGNPYMRMRDELGPIYNHQQFAPLFSNLGQPAEDPAQLALITIMQFAEGLSDRQTAEAVRGRMDWKYALGLELTVVSLNYLDGQDRVRGINVQSFLTYQ
jgi:transposase